MAVNSFIKELSGENITTQTTIASLGLSVLVLAFSIIGLAGFQPAEASDSVLSVLSSKPKVLGAQDYQMQVVYSGSTLDLAVTPYDFDANSGKWNYKVSWNRKSGTVGNININGNLFYQGAQGINEAYTGYSLSPSNSYSISYSYLTKSGRKYVTKVLTKKTFSTLGVVSGSNGVVNQSISAPQTQNTVVDPNKTSISLSKPKYGDVIDQSMQLSMVIFSPKSDLVGTAFYTLSLDNSTINIGEQDIPFTTVVASQQQATLEKTVDTSKLSNGSWTLSLGVSLKDNTKVYINPIKVTVNHSNASALGTLNLSSPTSSSILVGDNALNIVANGTSNVGFIGNYTIYLDDYSLATGYGQVSTDLKTFSLSTSIRNIPSSYIKNITEGQHKVTLKVGLVDRINSLADTKTITYAAPQVATAPNSVVRVYNDDINGDGIIDNNDYGALLSAISGSIACPSTNTCDVNGDGMLTVADSLAYRQILVNRYDFNKDGKITYDDYILMGDVVPGIITCPVTTCDFISGGGITMDDWKQLGKILNTFPDIKIY